MAVLVPVYRMKYSPSKSLDFCAGALVLTLIGWWTENRIQLSLPAGGMLRLQLF
jgi:hypothetical protein